MQRTCQRKGNLRQIKIRIQWKSLQNLLPTLHTNTESQGNLLQYYQFKSQQLLENQRLSKFCCDAGLRIVETGHFFITLEEKGPDWMKNSCREHTLLRTEPQSQPRGWIVGNTKICLVLDVKVCFRQERYGIEIMIESLFRDKTTSWIRIVNGIDNYVSENVRNRWLWNFWAQRSDGETCCFWGQRSNGETCCEGQTTTKALVTVSLVSGLLRDRKMEKHWNATIGSKCFAVSKSHDQITATWSVRSSRRWWSSEIWRYYEKFKAKFDGLSQWSVDDWIFYLAKGGGHKKRFQ